MQNCLLNKKLKTQLTVIIIGALGVTVDRIGNSMGGPTGVGYASVGVELKLKVQVFALFRTDLNEVIQKSNRLKKMIFKSNS